MKIMSIECANSGLFLLIIVYNVGLEWPVY